MDSSEYGQFTCEFCGKPHPWQPRYAGKKVRCECGEVMIAPNQPPAPHKHSGDDFDEYSLTEEPQPAKMCATPVTKPPTIAPDAASATANDLLAYQSAANSRQEPTTREDFANQIGGEPWREIHLPGGLLLLGLLLNIVLFARLTGSNASIAHILLPLGLTLLFNLILSFIGVLLVSKWFEISFGHPGTAVLKLSAVILVPSALAGFAALALGSVDVWTMMGVRLIIVMPMTLIGLLVLFRLSLDEAFYCMAAIYLVTQWATLFLVPTIATEPSGSNTAAAVVLQAGTRPTTDQNGTNPHPP